MEITHILIDDKNPVHRELSIYRTGEISRIRLSDTEYRTYGTLAISAHNHTALFHFDLIESLNALPFISETGQGLDSWDEAFLDHSQLEKMLGILREAERKIEPEKKEKALLGWHDKPLLEGNRPERVPGISRRAENVHLKGDERTIRPRIHPVTFARSVKKTIHCVRQTRSGTLPAAHSPLRADAMPPRESKYPGKSRVSPQYRWM